MQFDHAFVDADHERGGRQLGRYRRQFNELGLDRLGRRLTRGAVHALAQAGSVQGAFRRSLRYGDDGVPPGDAPPRAIVEARLANPAWRIEIVVTAALRV